MKITSDCDCRQKEGMFPTASHWIRVSLRGFYLHYPKENGSSWATGLWSQQALSCSLIAWCILHPSENFPMCTHHSEQLQLSDCHTPCGRGPCGYGWIWHVTMWQLVTAPILQSVSSHVLCGYSTGTSSTRFTMHNELFPYFFRTKRRSMILVVSVCENHTIPAYLEICFCLL